jgi:hypothetical protein
LFGTSRDALYADPNDIITTVSQTVPVENKISLDAFVEAARGILEDADISRLERFRTRLDPRGFTKSAWLRIVLDLKGEDKEGP